MFSFTVNPRQLREENFTLSARTVTNTFGYPDTTYGTITAENIQINNQITASYTSSDENVATVDDNGNITVANGLNAGTYNFIITATASGDDYSGSVPFNLTLVVNPAPISESDFNVSARTITKEIGYPDTDNAYGTITAKDGQTVNYTITSSDAPNNEISVNATGTITVASGLALGTYKFTVTVTGRDNYTGTATFDLELVVSSGTTRISESDFSASTRNVTKIFNYNDTSYGTITPNNNQITVAYSSSDTTIANVDNAGKITIVEGLAAKTHTFTITATASGRDYSGTATFDFELVVNPITIAEGDFSVSPRSRTKVEGYSASDNAYGTITAKAGQTVTYTSSDTGIATVDATGTITVALGLGIATYKFTITATGRDNYSGTATFDFTFTVNRATITENDFTASRTSFDINEGYPETAYGSITPNSGQTASYTSSDESIATVDAAGNISVVTGLEADTYTFAVTVQGNRGYDGIFTEIFTFTVNQATITANNFTASRTSFDIDEGYPETAYGSITGNNGETATYTSSDESIATVDADGNISVVTGLAIGNYNFAITVTGTDNYTGSFDISFTLTVNKVFIPITAANFTTSFQPAQSQPAGYSTFTYGTVERTGGVTADLAIIDSTAPDGVITIDNTTGEITVNAGLDIQGTYTFKVEATGTGDYIGTLVVADLIFTVDIPTITAANFTISFSTDQVQPAGYSAFTYGTVERNGGVTADLAITASTAPAGVITIDNTTGEITVNAGLNTVDSYTFKVEATGTGFYTGTTLVVAALSFTVEYPAFFQNVYNISDDPSTTPPTRLWGAMDVTTAELNGTTYLFTGAQRDGYLNAHRIADDGTATIVSSIDDNLGAPSYALRGVTSVSIGNTTYIYQAIANNNIVKAYAFPDGGNVTSIQNVVDNNSLTSPLFLAGASDVVTTPLIGGFHYLFAAGRAEFGIQGFGIDLNGTLFPLAGLSDSGNLRLAGVRSLEVAEVGGTPYLFAAGERDNGISVFEIKPAPNNRITLNSVYDTPANLEGVLAGVTSLATAQLAGTSYLFAGAQGGEGTITAFTIAGNGELTRIATLTGADTLFQITNPFGLTAREIGGAIYLFASSENGDSVSMLKLEANRLTGLVSVIDDGTTNVNDSTALKLDAPYGMTTAEIGGNLYLFVAGYDDRGVSIFRVTGN